MCIKLTLKAEIMQLLEVFQGFYLTSRWKKKNLKLELNLHESLANSIKKIYQEMEIPAFNIIEITLLTRLDLNEKVYIFVLFFRLFKGLVCRI